MDFKLRKFKERFDLFFFYENKLPGVAKGLSVLRFLQAETRYIVLAKDSKSNFDGVEWYDFIESNFESYCYESLNVALRCLYDHFFSSFERNSLYKKFCDVFDITYGKYNYKYRTDFYDKRHLVSRLFQIMRNNSKKDFFTFDINPLILGYKNIQYFQENVTGEQFYNFMLDYFMDLQKAKIWSYNQDFSFTFDSLLVEDLNKLKYSSYELMHLGDNNIYQGEEKIYQSFNTSDCDFGRNLALFYDLYISSDSSDVKTFINDILVSMVISSSVEIICADQFMNNTFVEKLRDVQTK